MDSMQPLGRVAGQHVHQARGEGPDPAHVPVGVDVFDPAVEDVDVPECPFETVGERLLGQELAGPGEGVLDYPPGQGAHPQGHLQRLLQVLVALQGEMLAGLDEEVDDLLDRNVERRPGLAARGKQLVELEPGGDEGNTEVSRQVLGVVAPHHPAPDEVGHPDPGLCAGTDSSHAHRLGLAFFTRR